MNKHVNKAGGRDSSNIKPSRIVTHHRPHQDELLALYLLRTQGGSVFPGIRDMDIVFLRKEIAKVYADSIYIGVGFGEFDEHRPDGRLQGTCAAMLVAQRLRLANSSKFGPLVQEVLHCDTTLKGSEPFKVSQSMLESLVKAMHRVRKGQMQRETYIWSAKAFDAIVYGRPNDSFNLCDAWKGYCLDHGLDMKDLAIQRVSGIVGNSARTRGKNLTELCSIVCRMDPQVRGSWLDETFGMLTDDARLYRAAFKEVDDKGSTFEVVTQKGQEIGAFVVSDNEHAGYVMRSDLYGETVITITRTSSGNTHIMVNPKQKDDVDLVRFAAMVRMAEYRARTGKRLAKDRAEGFGTRAEVPQWSLAFKGLLLNGSLTHPDVEPSRLSIPDLNELAKHAFTDIGFEGWKAQYYAAPEGQTATA